MLMAVFGMTGVYVSEQNAEKRLAQEQAKEEQQRLETARAEEEQQLAAVDRVVDPTENDFLDEPDVISDQRDIPRESLDEVIQETQEDGAQANGATEVATEQADETQETASQPIQLSFDGATEMGWPLVGNVIMDYSMDRTVYFATLDQYKYNPAIVIQGNVNDKILSVADGKVSNIETNEVTGCTVTVDLGDGYSAVYGQLKEVPVHAGDYIEAGAIVGYISEPTKYYSLEGANLYFQILKDNASVDPMEFLQ